MKFIQVFVLLHQIYYQNIHYLLLYTCYLITRCLEELIINHLKCSESKYTCISCI